MPEDKAQRRQNVAKNGADFGAWRGVVQLMPEDKAQRRQNVAKNGADFGAWRGVGQLIPKARRKDGKMSRKTVLILARGVASVS